jgi:hypothetical protein
MESIKINIHSMTDLITNSSTTIFTYSGASLQICKDMINEIFKAFNIKQTADDIFHFVVLADDPEEVYGEYLNNLLEDEEELPEGFTEDNIDDVLPKLIDDVKHGRVEEPKWFEDAENVENDYGYTKPTTFYITPRAEKYLPMAMLIKKFLYSTNHGAFRDD